MAAEVEERGPIPNLALNALLIPVLDETSQVYIYIVNLPRDSVIVCQCLFSVIYIHSLCQTLRNSDITYVQFCDLIIVCSSPEILAAYLFSS